LQTAVTSAGRTNGFTRLRHFQGKRAGVRVRTARFSGRLWLPTNPETPHERRQCVAPLLRRIADALDRLAPPPARSAGLDVADAFVWNAESGTLEPVPEVARVDLPLLKGIDRLRDILLDNTRRFARGLPANNALLWGARGMGKSSLVKAAHAAVNAETPGSLILIEIHREDIESLPRLMVWCETRRGVA